MNSTKTNCRALALPPLLLVPGLLLLACEADKAQLIGTSASSSGGGGGPIDPTAPVIASIPSPAEERRSARRSSTSQWTASRTMDRDRRDRGGLRRLQSGHRHYVGRRASI